jgi:hypothetical protein
MSLSDCVNCWDTPCVCGTGYKHMQKAERINLAAVILGIDAKQLETLVGDIVAKKESQ